MKITAFGIVLALLLLPVATICQISIGPSGTYAQNFAFLGTTDYSLTNNAPANLGIYATNSTTLLATNTFAASTGTILGAAGFRNLGSAASADRALGTVLGLPASGTNNFLGLRIQNDSGATAAGIRIRYTGEQWRDASNAIQTLAFSYQVSAGDITSLTAGTFTAFPALDFATPIITNTAAPLDGNAPANRTAFDQSVTVSIPAGSEIMLRWADTNDPGGDEANLGIDDVFVTLLIPSAAPIAVSGRVTTANGSGIGNAVLVLTGGSLAEPLIARTNAFGYYQIDGAPAGATYLLEVSSKRYSFSPASLVINAQDNVADANFVSDTK